MTSLEAILEDPTAKEFLDRPHKLMMASWAANRELGSSTLVIVSLPAVESKLYTAYIGDSGYCILRRGSSQDYEVLFQSKSQQRNFNFPYQLGWSTNGDHPDLAVELSHDVQHHDIVIVSTDGVLDNLDPVSVQSNKHRSPRLSAMRLKLQRVSTRIKSQKQSRCRPSEIH